MSAKKSLIKSFFGVGAMKLASIPIGLFTSVVLARGLGPASFGEYAFVMSLLALLSLPLTGGMQSLLSREITKSRLAENYSTYRGITFCAYCWVLLVSVILFSSSAILAWLAPLFTESNRIGLLAIVIISLPFIGMNSVHNGTLKGLGFPAIAELPRMFLQPVFVLVGLSTLYVLDLVSIERALSLQVISVVLTSIFYYCFLVQKRPMEGSLGKHIRRNYEIKSWASSLGHFFLIALVGTLGAQVGIIALGLFGDSEDIAALRVAERASQFVGMSIALVNLVIVPHVVKAYKESKLDSLQKLSRESARGALLIAAPIGFFLLFFGEWFVKKVFGVEYSSIAYMPMAILVSGQLVNVFFGSVGFILAMTGNEKSALKGHVVSLFLNVILCAALIPIYGAIGAAIAVSASLILWNFVLGYYVSRKVGIRPSAL